MRFPRRTGGAAEQPFRNRDLLLVATAELPSGLLDVAALDLQVHDLLPRGGRFRAGQNSPAAPGKSPQLAECRVVADRPFQEQAIRLAILGDHRHPATDRLLRTVEPPGDRIARDEHFASVRQIRAKDRPQQLRSSRADQPRDPQSFTRGHFEADPIQDGLASQVLHSQTRTRLPVAGMGLPNRSRFVTGHQADHPVLIQFRYRLGGDPATIPQDAHAVRDRHDLVQAMADVQDRDPGLAKAAEVLKQAADFGGGQRGGRLIQNQHAAVAVQRRRDFDQLLIPDAELTGECFGRDLVQIHPRQGADRAGMQLAAIDP